MNRMIALTNLSLLLCFHTFSQNVHLIQLSGVVVNSDSLQPIPFAHVIVKNSYRGTVSDYYGYFSIVMRENDTLGFSSVGYKTADYVLPDTIKGNNYSLIQLLYQDTIKLPAAVVYPWPSREQFKRAFLNFSPPDDDLSRAGKNLANAEMQARMEAVGMDASANYRYQLSQYQSQLYYSGQYPPINLLNPIAWSKFIKAWKNGDFNNSSGK